MAPPPLSNLRVVDWTEQDEFYPARGAWQSWVRCDAKLSMTARTVAVEITDRISHDKNGAWPSQLFIAARLGCSDRTVRTAVGELFERGWLAARRGGFEGKAGEAPKSGVRASYTYIMAVHPKVLAEVLTAEGDRIAAFKFESASIPYRQKIAGMLLAAKPEESCRSNRKISSALTGRILPPKPEESCRIIYSENLSSEPVHGISEDKRLGDREQDRSQGRTILPSKSQTPVHLDDNEADDAAEIEEDILRGLGGGDLATGRRLALLLGPGRMSHLEQLALAEGVGGAGEAIYAAAKVAWKLEADAQNKVTT